MNIIEKEAEEFYEYGFLNSGIYENLENIKSSLTTKLYNFNRERDKLDFLKIIRQIAIKDKEEHMKSCNGCGYDKARDIAVFAIDQEVDEINSFFTHKPKSNDEFSVEQESELHNKLNNILKKLNEQGFGQQIIFDEIEDLKNHFNLGKKNWFQLLKGKVVDLTFKKILNKTIVQEIYNQLSEGFEQVVKMIE
jgi:hypothetical protein